MVRAVASIEARMGSTRLPGKVLADVGGAPALTRLLRRLRRAQRLDDIVLATTTSPADDELAEWAEAEGLPCHRGSEDDVLLRVVEAQRMAGGEIVVEVCGDTPLLDPAVVDMAVEAFNQGGAAVVTTCAERMLPDGIDVEVFHIRDLELVAETVTDPDVREHVSLHFYRQPNRYRIRPLMVPAEWRRPELRLVLDESEDLDLIRAVYERLEPEHGDTFGTAEIIALFDREPALMEINRAHAARTSVESAT